MFKYLFVILVNLFIFTFNLFASNRGCCSWHGGVAGCSNGRIVCSDGTFSPTCRCNGVVGDDLAKCDIKTDDKSALKSDFNDFLYKKGYLNANKRVVNSNIDKAS